MLKIILTIFWVLHFAIEGTSAQWYKVQSWGFTSGSTAWIILAQVLSIVTCGSRAFIEMTACD